MPRKVKTAFDGGADEDRAITGIHDIAFISRERDGVKGFEIRVGGGTSIMPRVAPTLYDFVDGRQRRVPQGRRGRLPHLRPPGLAARQPRPRPHQGPRRQVRHRRDAAPGRGGAQGRLGQRARLRPRPHALRRRRGGRNAPRPPGGVRQPQRRRLGVRALPRGQRHPPAPGGLLDRPGQGHPRRPDPRAVPRARRRSCATSPAATPAPRCTRTCCCAGSATSPSTRSGSALDELGLGDAGADRDHRRRLVPGHRLLQARHHQLDGPQRGRPRAPGRDGHHRPAHAAHPHQDERLPQRLQPAPHRQHRVLRRVDQGRRAHDPRPTSPHIAGNYEGGEVVYGHAPEGAPARQARARRRRALDPPVRGRAQTTARSSTPSPGASAPSASRTRSATWRCRSSSASRT